MEMMGKGGEQFELPGMEEFMKGTTAYVTVEKKAVQQLADVLSLESDMIQALASQCEVQIDTMNTIMPHVAEDMREKLAHVSGLFADRFDELFKFFLQVMQEIGLPIDVSTIWPDEPEEEDRGTGKAEVID